MGKKGQVSIEYMMVIGFVTVLVIPLILIYFKYSNDTRDSVLISQATRIVRQISDNAETVYYLGKPSQTTLTLNFPDGIESANLSNKEVLLKIKTRRGTSDIVDVSKVSMNGTLPITNGIHTLTLKAEDGFVQITSR